nr:MAG TPA: hypothetical protein [Caudoviricetes sp.]
MCIPCRLPLFLSLYIYIIPHTLYFVNRYFKLFLIF